jgi:metal-responsive CopG/Arc/MetJ family transcriptional regulator
METKGKPLCIYADDAFLASLDAWAKAEQVSRSLAIRQIVTDFLTKDSEAGQ